MSWLSNLFKRKAVSVTTPRKSYSELIPTLKIIDSHLLDCAILRQKFMDTRERYEVVSHMTGVPSDLLFALHYREASLNFNTCLHNGDKLPGPTTHVPKGRGPFKSWEEAAIDSIVFEQYKFPKEWTFENKLKFAESFNGMGYYKRNLPSPYVLSWTNEYKSGKYIADGKFDPSFVDKQCGVAAILLILE
jgi:lysozyme family protein